MRCHGRSLPQRNTILSRYGATNDLNNSCRNLQGNGFNAFDSDSEPDPVIPARPEIFPDDITPPKIGPYGEPSSERRYNFWRRFSGEEDESLLKQSNVNNSGLYRIGSGRSVDQLKEKSISLGESAVKTVEKLKEVGICQSQRLVMRNAADEQKQRDELLSSGVKDVAHSSAITERDKGQNRKDFCEERDMGNQSVQELESYAVSKSEETTDTMKNCVNLAEEMRDDASKTLINLHQQGERITRLHMEAANIDYDLSRGEKLLGSLGGIFSKAWIPKKSRSIVGPLIMTADSLKHGNENIEQRIQLGVAHSPRVRFATRHYTSSSANAQEKIQIEKAKQDDALSDLSNLLDEMKVMAIDMGSKIERQNKALDPFLDDVEELNYRMEGARQCGRRLLRK